MPSGQPGGSAEATRAIPAQSDTGLDSARPREKNATSDFVATIAHSRGKDRNAIQRMWQTKRFGAANQDRYQKILSERANNVSVTEDHVDGREVTEIRVPEPPHGYGANLSESLTGSHRNDEKAAGRTMREVSIAYQRSTQRYAEAMRSGDTTQAEDARTEALRIARQFVSVNIPTEPSLGAAGRRAVEDAILAAAEVTATRVVGKISSERTLKEGTQFAGTSENRAYYEHAPHVVAINDPDGGIRVTTVYGPAEVQADGSVIPTETRKFRRGRLFNKRLESRGVAVAPVEVSTVRINRSTVGTTRPDQQDVTDWEISYVGVDGRRTDAISRDVSVTRGETSPVYDYRGIFVNGLKNHAVQVYAHEGQYNGVNLTVVTSNPRLEESQLGRFDDVIEQAIEASENGEVGHLTVTDIRGLSDRHGEGLRIIDAKNRVREGENREVEAINPREAEVWIPRSLRDEAVRELNHEAYLDMVIGAARQNASARLQELKDSNASPGEIAQAQRQVDRLGRLTRQVLEQNPQLIQVSSEDVPSADVATLTADQVRDALDKQADDINYFRNRERSLHERDIVRLSPEVLMIVLDQSSDQIGIPEARQHLQDLRDPLLQIPNEMTRREFVRGEIRKIFAGDSNRDVYADKNDRVIAERLLDTLVPSEAKADFVTNVVGAEQAVRSATAEVTRLATGIATGEATPIQLAEAAQQLADANARLEQAMAGVPEASRAELRRMFAQAETAPAPAGEVVNGLMDRIRAEQVALESVDPNDRATLTRLAERLNETRVYAERHSLAANVVEAMREAMQPRAGEMDAAARLNDKVTRLREAQTEEERERIRGEFTVAELKQLRDALPLTPAEIAAQRAQEEDADDRAIRAEDRQLALEQRTQEHELALEQIRLQREQAQATQLEAQARLAEAEALRLQLTSRATVQPSVAAGGSESPNDIAAAIAKVASGADAAFQSAGDTMAGAGDATGDTN